MFKVFKSLTVEKGECPKMSKMNINFCFSNMRCTVGASKNSEDS